MIGRRVWRAAAVAAALLLAIPGAAWAQSAFAGVVRDTSGAVMPGVTVEAASPVLIEKVRSAITDENGAYRIVDLRPGTYTLTFSLAGFNTQIREGVELAANFVATINVDLSIGTLQESVTVSGASPVRKVTIDGCSSPGTPTGVGHSATPTPAPTPTPHPTPVALTCTLPSR